MHHERTAKSQEATGVGVLLFGYWTVLYWSRIPTGGLGDRFRTGIPFTCSVVFLGSSPSPSRSLREAIHARLLPAFFFLFFFPAYIPTQICRGCLDVLRTWRCEKDPKAKMVSITYNPARPMGFFCHAIMDKSSTYAAPSFRFLRVVRGVTGHPPRDAVTGREHLQRKGPPSNIGGGRTLDHRASRVPGLGFRGPDPSRRGTLGRGRVPLFLAVAVYSTYLPGYLGR